QRGGSVTTGSALVFVEQHDGPRGNNPRDEEEAEVDAANNLPGTAQRRGNALPCRACRADGSKPRNLQPCRSFSGGKSSSQVQLLCFFAAKFSTGSFGDAARRN